MNNLFLPINCVRKESKMLEKKWTQKELCVISPYLCGILC